MMGPRPSCGPLGPIYRRTVIRDNGSGLKLSLLGSRCQNPADNGSDCLPVGCAPGEGTSEVQPAVAGRGSLDGNGLRGAFGFHGGPDRVQREEKT